MRVKMETFHVYTSTLLDRIARHLPSILRPIEGDRREQPRGLLEAGEAPEGHYVLAAAVENRGDWLQNNVDWYRNRVIIHPEGLREGGIPP